MRLFVYMLGMVVNNVLNVLFVNSQCMWNPCHYTSLSLYEEAWLWNWSQCVSHGQVDSYFIHYCYSIVKMKSLNVYFCLHKDGKAGSFPMGY